MTNRHNKEEVLKAVNKNGLALEYVSEELQDIFGVNFRPQKFYLSEIRFLNLL